MKRSWRGWRAAAGMAGSLLVLLATTALATEVWLKDGRILRGRKGDSVGLAEQNGASEADSLKQIVFVNDDFRLIFVSRRQVVDVKPDATLENAEKFELIQQQKEAGRDSPNKVLAVGPPAGALKDFDEYGWRDYPMLTARGVQHVIQGITELTPQYIRVEAKGMRWDERIATNTLSNDLLDKILMHQIDPKNVEQRKKIARFYLQCKRFGMAMSTLQKILDDFKNDTQVAQDIQPTLQKVRLLYAQQSLDELGLRLANGQYDLVQKILNEFADKDFHTEELTGEILQTIRQAQEAYKAYETKRSAIDKSCQDLLSKVEGRVDRAALAPALREMGPGLKPEMLPRMAAFLLNQNDTKLTPEVKLSLAVSGFLLGPDSASTDLPLTKSAWRLRGLVQDYLTEPVKVRRDSKLLAILSEAAAQPELLAALAAHMSPPYPLPEPLDKEIPGYAKLTTSVLSGQPDATYYVQLPPEYDPHRRYPMIVSLHSLGHDPTMQIEWWAGEHDPKRGPGRQGQAGRYGYIVIAPDWTVPHQTKYESSAREHAVVLGCLRDACRRFAVDTDRVFLHGHAEGGDAAWDIGLSHPDLWAGVIPVSAKARDACIFYRDNARYVPFYVVLGELDGNRVAHNATVIDRYFKDGDNTTVVEYIGRGHEHFLDEQLPMFDWMNRFRRSFPLPAGREFKCETMRECDNHFWWAEIANLPPNSIATSWPPHGTQPLQVTGNAPGTNTLVLTAGNSRATIWLSPEMVNFNARINITVGRRRPNGVPAMIKPSVETMLEDLRVRGDRQHPFWAKVETR